MMVVVGSYPELKVAVSSGWLGFQINFPIGSQCLIIIKLALGKKREIVFGFVLCESLRGSLPETWGGNFSIATSFILESRWPDLQIK